MSVTTQTTEEHVVLADAHGRPAGTAPKASVHHRETPLHLAFSCHVVDSSGRVLLARRAAGKRTWPATWSNACCGHPQLGETLREAVVRRLADELGLAPRRLGLAIPDFAYRAVMEDGTTEHELCPVVVAEVEGEPSPNRAEVDAVQWVGWDELRHRADAEPLSLSPWSVLQIEGLAALAPSPRQWLEHSPHGGLLDHPVGRPAPLDGRRLLDRAGPGGRPVGRSRSGCSPSCAPPRCGSAPPTPGSATSPTRSAGSSSGAASGCAPPSCTGATPPPARPATTGW